MLRFLLALTLIAVLLPGSALAQATAAGALTEATFAADCLAVYPLGRLSLDLITPVIDTSVAPGDVVTISGRISNPTRALLTDSSVFIRVLHEDQIVEEVSVDNLDVASAPDVEGGRHFFTTDWQVPAFTPPGVYMLDLFFRAADGAPIVVGTSRSFTVEDGGVAARLTLAPIVVPAIQPGETVTLNSSLTATGEIGESVSIRKTLYAGRELTGGKVLAMNDESVVYAAGQTVPVEFTSETLAAGEYEFVVRAESSEKHVLPLIMRVPFTVGEAQPQVVHVGTLAEDDGSVTAVACFTAAGVTDTVGKLHLVVDETVVDEAEPVMIGEHTVNRLYVPADILSGSYSLVAELQGADGAILASRSVQFGAPEGVSSDYVTWPPWVLGLAGAVGLILIAGVLFLIMRRRRLYTEPL